MFEYCLVMHIGKYRINVNTQFLGYKSILNLLFSKKCLQNDG